MGRLALAWQMEREEEELQEMEEELQYVGIDEADREILNMQLGDIEEPAVVQLQPPVLQPQRPDLQPQRPVLQIQQVLQMLLSPILGLPEQQSSSLQQQHLFPGL